MWTTSNEGPVGSRPHLHTSSAARPTTTSYPRPLPHVSDRLTIYSRTVAFLDGLNDSSVTTVVHKPPANGVLAFVPPPCVSPMTQRQLIISRPPATRQVEPRVRSAYHRQRHCGRAASERLGSPGSSHKSSSWQHGVLSAWVSALASYNPHPPIASSSFPRSPNMASQKGICFKTTLAAIWSLVAQSLPFLFRSPHHKCLRFLETNRDQGRGR